MIQLVDAMYPVIRIEALLTYEVHMVRLFLNAGENVEPLCLIVHTKNKLAQATRHEPEVAHEVDSTIGEGHALLVGVRGPV